MEQYLETGPLGGNEGMRVEPSRWDLCPYETERACFLSLGHVWIQCEDGYLQTRMTALTRNQTCPRLGPGLPTSRTVRTICCVRHSVHGILLQQPKLSQSDYTKPFNRIKRMCWHGKKYTDQKHVNRTSQLQHHWRPRPCNYLLLGTVLCIVRCLAVSMASAH